MDSRRQWALKELGLSEGASQRAILEAYRDLARVWHPDHYADNPRLQEKANAKLKTLNQAREILLGTDSGEPLDDATAQEDVKSQAPPHVEPPPSPSAETPSYVPDRPKGRSWLLALVAIPILFAGYAIWAGANKADPPRQAAQRAPRPLPTPESTTHKEPAKLINDDPKVESKNPYMDLPAAKSSSSIEVHEGSVAEASTSTFVYESPSEDSKALYRLSAHTAIIIAPTSLPSWYQVFLLNYTYGFVLKRCVTPTENVATSSWIKKWKKENFTRAIAQKFPKARVVQSHTSGEDYYSMDSPQDEVKRIQGPPTAIHGDSWDYDFSSVRFQDGYVVGWSNISDNLRVRWAPSTLSQGISNFTVGSTLDDVLTVQGTPSSVRQDSIDYQFSTVRLANGKVVGWSNISKNLKIKLDPTTRSEGISTFTVGSTVDDVLTVQGTPSSIRPDSFDYDFSTVHFRRGKVVGYSDISHNLKVR